MTTEAQKLEKKYWLDQAEDQWKRDVFQRDNGICVCGAPIEQAHHLLGREKKSVGYKSLPPEIKALWTIQQGDFSCFNPHIEPNGRGLCLAHHVPFAHRFGPIVRKLLLLEILDRCDDSLWMGETYWRLYHRPPFVVHLR